jgi:hypothetical protein
MFVKWPGHIFFFLLILLPRAPVLFRRSGKELFVLTKAVTVIRVPSAEECMAQQPRLSLGGVVRRRRK